MKTDMVFSLAQVPANDFTAAFWPLVAALIPEAVMQPQTCEEIFSLSHHLFKNLAETPIHSLLLDDLVGQWSALLLSHIPDEVSQYFQGLCGVLISPQSVGHAESLDPVAYGLANLLYCAASFAKASQQPLSARQVPLMPCSWNPAECLSNVGLDLLRKHLFPELSFGEVAKPRIPLLNNLTRQLIAETVYFLVKDDKEQYERVSLYLAQLVPYDDKIDEGMLELHQQ